MKIFIASLITENNTFSPLPTGAASFYAPDTYRRRDASLDDTAAETICQKTWRRMAERDSEMGDHGVRSDQQVGRGQHRSEYVERGIAIGHRIERPRQHHPQCLPSAWFAALQVHHARPRQSGQHRQTGLRGRKE